MTPTVITPAAGEPVSLAAMKDYLRIGHDGEDALVSGLVASARARIEREAGLALVSRTLRLTLPAWPVDLVERGLRLSPGPVERLVAVRLTGAAPADLTDRFTVRGDRLCLASLSGLAAIPAGGAVEADYDAGYGAPTAVPEDLQLAVKLAAAHAYQRRRGGAGDDDADGLPAEVAKLLAARRQVRL